jgi:HD superfamily phosphohydrolase
VPNNYKLFSDPVHGFISVPKGLMMALIQQPEVQRLRRIRQLGVGHLVFPGAEHTRFNHALGAMALMQDALAGIEGKGTPVSPTERTAALAAALLHDVGHGPYSHTLEHYLIRDFHHEQMSRRLLVRLAERLAEHPEGDALRLALDIFDGEHERAFFHQLVSSQLDMDRLDYLRRDAFYTGVAEGEVGVERLLKTLRVTPPAGRSDAPVAVEAKGIYAVENFLISRRLMYWQVYLHKTVLAGDELLRAAFRRVRWHFREGRPAIGDGCSPALCFFLENDITGDDLSARLAATDHYAALDDTDVLFSLKQWQHAGDPVLADLCRRFIDRDFFRVTFLPEQPTDEQLDRWRSQVARWLEREGLARDRSCPASFDEAARYYLTQGRSRHRAYQRERGEAIGIVGRDGQVRELSEMADTAALTALSERVVKPYVCYPKEVDLDLSPAPASSA